MHYVYILESVKDKKLYYGYTNNLKSRIALHNAGKVFSTAPRRPLKLIYYESYSTQEDAREREKFFKTGWGRNYIKRVMKHYFTKKI